MAPDALTKQKQNKKYSHGMAIYFVCIDTHGAILLRDFCIDNLPKLARLKNMQLFVVLLFLL
jgi:hypothetical protein